MAAPQADASHRETGLDADGLPTPQGRTTTSSAPAASFVAASSVATSPVVLRPWRSEDLPLYREWLRPHHEWHLWDGPYYARPTDEQADAAVARQARAIAEAASAQSTVQAAATSQGAPPVADAESGTGLPPHSLVVARGADGAFLGTVTWYWESEETEWARVGIVLHDPASRGTGAGTAALGLWTTLLFESTGWRRLDLATWSGNHAMVRVAERLGFTLEGRFREARVVRGEVYDSLVYGVLREEWRQRMSAVSQP